MDEEILDIQSFEINEYNVVNHASIETSSRAIRTVKNFREFERIKFRRLKNLKRRHNYLYVIDSSATLRRSTLGLRSSLERRDFSDGNLEHWQTGK